MPVHQQREADAQLGAALRRLEEAAGDADLELTVRRIRPYTQPAYIATTPALNQSVSERIAALQGSMAEAIEYLAGILEARRDADD